MVAVPQWIRHSGIADRVAIGLRDRTSYWIKTIDHASALENRNVSRQMHVDGSHQIVRSMLPNRCGKRYDLPIRMNPSIRAPTTLDGDPMAKHLGDAFGKNLLDR